MPIEDALCFMQRQHLALHLIRGHFHSHPWLEPDSPEFSHDSFFANTELQTTTPVREVTPDPRVRSIGDVTVILSTPGASPDPSTTAPSYPPITVLASPITLITPPALPDAGSPTATSKVVRYKRRRSKSPTATEPASKESKRPRQPASEEGIQPKDQTLSSSQASARKRKLSDFEKTGEE
ncbi:hypothetical protein SISNIDRAFT_50352 [Sistotremastrum niveocremeum HHB9708]|uniref:Uncharacterized protein n=1 Tax=Sistotremastrum niveocremeum HHB9708 TaxID=1314777 RepID=A0A164VZ85_9AGAM|nr:hypothetical protein SISNIDRAFT_50352 [Sistotremastrum niveocremeum HHB9708]